MKKVVAILLVLLMLAMLTACGQKTEQTYVLKESLRTIGEAELRTDYVYAKDGTVAQIKIYLNGDLMRTTVNRTSNGLQYVSVTEANGQVSTQTIESVHNDAGQLVLVTTVYGGMTTVTTKYTYNDQGQVVKVVSAGPDGETVTTYTYDEQGNPICQLQINEKAEAYLRIEAVYDDNSFVIKESTYSAEDVLDGYVEISYAKENTEKTLTYYDGAGNPTGQVVVKTFDENGNEIQEVISRNGEVAQTTVNTYVMMEVPVKEK